MLVFVLFSHRALTRRGHGMMVVVMMMLVIVMVMVIVIVVMILLEMHIEFRALNVGLLAAGGMDMEFAEVQFFQLVLQLAEIDTKVEDRPDEHIAADATEHIEIKRLHSNSPAASALI